VRLHGVGHDGAGGAAILARAALQAGRMPTVSCDVKSLNMVGLPHSFSKEVDHEKQRTLVSRSSLAFTLPVVGLLIVLSSLQLASAGVEEVYTLAVHIEPTLAGAVIKTPDQMTYTSGTVVTLTAIPYICSGFDGWSGDLTDTANPVTITMDSNKAVTATFLLAPCIPQVVGQVAAGNFVTLDSVTLTVRFGDYEMATDIDASGNFTFTSIAIPYGVYTMCVKEARTLAMCQANVDLRSISTTTEVYLGDLTSGDADGNNFIDFLDFFIWDQLLGTADVEGDFNNDGFVDTADFVILKANLGQAGDPFPVKPLIPTQILTVTVVPMSKEVCV
jgi:hypothetical protein